MTRTSSKRSIRIGVIGVGRGMSLATRAKIAGLDVVAICDTWEEKLVEAGKQLGVATYADFDKFLEHDMDAVVLANYFHQHVPFAIKALRAGKHVMSETAACFTLAEGVQLVREVERSGLIYMFAENYPYMLFNQEMRRIYRTGRLGTFMYGEGEYVHPGPAEWVNSLSPGVNHWRNWLPATYYCTHALAPIMFITDTRPVTVNGFVIRRCDDDPVSRLTPKQSDAASMIALRMDNGAVAKLLQVGLRGESIWVRIHGSRGAMENLRVGDKQMVRLIREQFEEKRAEPVEQIYKPDWPAGHEQATKAGHGGGDYFVSQEFAQAIRRNEPPFLDVYRGVAMSIVGPLAYRSALAGGVPLEVPDFRREADRRKYATDHWSPDPTDNRPGPAPSIDGKRKISPKALAFARKVWRRQGYTGQ